MVTFSHFYVGSILYNRYIVLIIILLLYTACIYDYIKPFGGLLHYTSYNAIFSGNQTRLFSQNSTVLTEVDGSRRTRSILGTNNAEKEGTSAIVGKYRRLIKTLKEARVGQIVLSGILPIMGGRGEEYRNCRRMAINTQVQKVCMEEGVGFVDMWLNFVGRYDFFMRDGLHLTGKGAAVLGCEFVRVVDEGTGTINYLN